MNVMIGVFAIGFMIGGIFGILTMALLVASRDENDR